MPQRLLSLLLAVVFLDLLFAFHHSFLKRTTIRQRESARFQSTRTQDDCDVRTNVIPDLSTLIIGDTVKIESISDNQFYTEVLEKSKRNYLSLNLVLFASSWCMPCKVMLRNMKALSGSSLQLDRLSFYEIDTDHNFDAASELNIRSIPSLVMIRDGKVLSEIVGSISLLELEKEVAANLA